MASVRKREWTSNGVKGVAFVADYFDAKGKRHHKQFSLRKEAQEFLDSVKGEIKAGVHTPVRKSITVKEAGERWIRAAEAHKLERTTIESYRQHLDDHIVPYLGSTKLAQLTTPDISVFRDRLHDAKLSAAMIRRVVGDLGSIIATAQEAGQVAQNVVRSMHRRKKSNGQRKRKIEAGTDFPLPEEIREIIKVTDGRDRSVILVAAFAGLRSSEIRGLRWRDVDFRHGQLAVRQRADRYGEIGAPKSKAGTRTVPMTPTMMTALKALKLKSAAPDPDRLVFANQAGNPSDHANIVKRTFHRAQIAASVTMPVKDKQGRVMRDKDGRPIVRAKYTGLHVLRHFFASWILARPANGGLGLALNEAKERLGHSSIVMTADTYGHLLPQDNDAATIAHADAMILG